MKHKRSTSEHINLNPQLLHLKQQPSPPKNKLQEINNKINNMLIKVKSPNESMKTIETNLQKQLSNTKILTNIQKEKSDLLALLAQKEIVIKEQLIKIQELNLENSKLNLQVQQFQQISTQMEQLEHFCTKIVQENQQQKQQLFQMQTSFNFLQSNNLLQLGQEIEQSIHQLSKSQNKCFKLLEYACKQEFDNLQVLVNINSKSNTQHKQEGNLYHILKDSLEQLKRLIYDTDKQFDINYKQVSSNIFYSYNY